MIVIGYQGIGKSTLASKDIYYIDLESGNFWIDGKRADNWYKLYCKIAEHLSEQGYVVFVSSHEVVRKQLEDSTEHVVLVYPSIELKDQWINKLEKRYQRSGLEKDYKALMNAKDRYIENIQELELSDIEHKICLAHMDYDLVSKLEEMACILNEESYDPCYECGGYGDDYYINDEGELECRCPECPFNPSRRDDWDD